MIKERYSEVSFVTLPPLRMARLRVVSRTPEEDSIKVLNEWVAAAGIDGQVRRFGFDVEVSPEQSAAGLRGYESWYSVPPGIVPPGGLPAEPVTLYDFPGGRFAALTVYDPFKEPFIHIPAGWQTLHEWVAARELDKPGPMMRLEELVEREGVEDLVLYLPIRKEA